TAIWVDIVSSRSVSCFAGGNRSCGMSCYLIHMKRTNLVLDADLLERATRALGAKTYSAAVNQALEQVLRIEKIRGLMAFYGQELWEGDLSEMREDRPPRRSGHGKRKKPK